MGVRLPSGYTDAVRLRGDDLLLTSARVARTVAGAASVGPVGGPRGIASVPTAGAIATIVVPVVVVVVVSAAAEHQMIEEEALAKGPVAAALRVVLPLPVLRVSAFCCTQTFD